MSDTRKTLTFVAVGVALALVAVVISWPSSSGSDAGDLKGQLLYPDFKNPQAVASLEITEFNEETGEIHPFKVAQVDVKGKTRWSIPSHDDYPADAKDQVASAASSMMGLKILESVGDNQGDQREYGVVAPDIKTLKVGDTGVGERVVMKDKDDKTLLDLVIGKELRDRPGLRYVRKSGDDGVFVVELKTDKLSTKFEDWIERNLLQISSFDVSRLWIHDYAIKATREGPAIIQRGEMDLEHNDAGEQKWKMLEDRKFAPDDQNPAGGSWKPVKLAANEELNATKLDEMLTALDDLKIVDVSPKPKGVSAELKASPNFASKSNAAVASLADKGFYVAQLGKQIELFSNEGEIRVGGKDGVEYVLRFGDIAGRTAKEKKKTDKAGKPEAAKKDGSTGLNRYLFLMAEFNPNLIPKPRLEPMPKQEPDAKKAEAAKPNAKKADAKKSDKKADAKAAEQKEAEKKIAQAERARVEKENKRNQGEYDAKLAAGKKRAAELNVRFADWYYVISDDVYRKIHLGRDEIVQKKRPAPPKKTTKDE